jgi:hypothetical protein
MLYANESPAITGSDRSTMLILRSAEAASAVPTRASVISIPTVIAMISERIGLVFICTVS